MDRQGRIKKKELTVRPSDVGSTLTERCIEDLRAGDELGIGTTRGEDRIGAWRSGTTEAITELGNHQSVINAGVLLSIPALYGQGLEKVLKNICTLIKRFLWTDTHCIIDVFYGLKSNKVSRGAQAIFT